MSVKQKTKVLEPKVITQYCITGHFFEEVMTLPEKVKITQVFIECGFAIKRLSVPVPSSLLDMGVTAIRKATPSVEVEGLLTGTRASMIKTVSQICKELELKSNTVRVKRMTVEVGKNIGVFHRMQKQIPGDDDKLHRKIVLGLVKWQGSESAIADACSAKAFNCRYTVQPIRTVVCEQGN